MRHHHIVQKQPRLTKTKREKFCALCTPSTHFLDRSLFSTALSSPYQKDTGNNIQYVRRVTKYSRDPTQQVIPRNFMKQKIFTFGACQKGFWRPHSPSEFLRTPLSVMKMCFDRIVFSSITSSDHLKKHVERRSLLVLSKTLSIRV